MALAPLRRMRVRYFARHNPPVWEAMFEHPGRVTCYCHAPSLEAMCAALRDYFEGRGHIEPLRIEERFLRG